jgi:hypothetical protein
MVVIAHTLCATPAASVTGQDIQLATVRTPMPGAQLPKLGTVSLDHTTEPITTTYMLPAHTEEGSPLCDVEKS